MSPRSRPIRICSPATSPSLNSTKLRKPYSVRSVLNPLGEAMDLLIEAQTCEPAHKPDGCEIFHQFSLTGGCRTDSAPQNA